MGTDPAYAERQTALAARIDELVAQGEVDGDGDEVPLVRLPRAQDDA